MGRRRQSRLTLSGTRIYVRRKNYVYYAKEAVLNPKTAKVVKHHILCPVKDGEYRAREILKRITEPLGIAKNEGSFVTWLHKYRDKEIG